MPRAHIAAWNSGEGRAVRVLRLGQVARRLARRKKTVSREPTRDTEAGAARRRGARRARFEPAPRRSSRR